MAKKEKKQTTAENKPRARWRFTDMIAFIALALSALLIVLGPFLVWITDLTGTSSVISALNTVAQVLLFVALAIPAWLFVRKKRVGWIIAYFIVLIIFIVGTILGYI